MGIKYACLHCTAPHYDVVIRMPCQADDDDGDEAAQG